MRYFILLFFCLLSLYQTPINASDLKGIEPSNPFALSEHGLRYRQPFYESLTYERADQIAHKERWHGMESELLNICAHNFLIQKVFSGSKGAYKNWLHEKVLELSREIPADLAKRRLSFKLFCNLYDKDEYPELDLPYIKNLLKMSVPSEYHLYRESTHRFSVMRIVPFYRNNENREVTLPSLVEWQEIPEAHLVPKYKFGIRVGKWVVPNFQTWTECLDQTTDQPVQPQPAPAPEHPIIFDNDFMNLRYGSRLEYYGFLHKNELTDTGLPVELKDEIYSDFMATLAENYMIACQFSESADAFNKWVANKGRIFKRKFAHLDEDSMHMGFRCAFLFQDEYPEQNWPPVKDLLMMAYPHEKAFFHGCTLKFALYIYEIRAIGQIGSKPHECHTQVIWKSPHLENKMSE